MSKLNRREFLAASTAAALASSASGQSSVSPNDRLGVGLIGCGDQGTNHLRYLVRNEGVEVRAVCDVFKPRRDRAAEMSGGRVYVDYGDLLARDDIDCVWIATPDHWHARMGIDALEAGKDVYCEKPMGRYWNEARDFYRAAQRTGGIVQIGAQATSNRMYDRMRELVDERRLGRLILSQASFMRNTQTGDWNYAIEQRAASADLDWERFLGPAPPRPFDPERFFRWRKYWDYSGGLATDFLSHPFHPLCKGTGNEWPVRVVAAGGILLHPDREVPDTLHVLVDYESGHTIMLTAAQTTGRGVPLVVRGHRAYLELGRDRLLLWPDRLYAQEIEPETFQVETVADYIQAHHDNFLSCVRQRNQATNCPAELGYRVAIALDLASRSWRGQSVLRFDPVAERLIET
jgi:predicted dehydrogenase